MTPETFKQYLDAMRHSGIMQFSIKLEGLEMTGAFSADAMLLGADASGYGEPSPGGWKTELPHNLDMPLSVIAEEEAE